MLVLSRKAGEKIRIGHNVELVVTQIGKGRVRLGIVAPENVHIRRSELPNWSDRPSDGHTAEGTHTAEVTEETYGVC
jgi:carbon storage regulator CsrA